MTDQPEPISTSAARQREDLPFMIDLRRVHLAVGWIAFGLPLSLLALSFSPGICFHGSISHFYFTPIGGDILVGALSFIALLLICLYSFDAPGCAGTRAWRWYDIVLIRLAGFAAFGVAFVPTTGSGCNFDGVHNARVLLRDATGAQDFPLPGGRVEGQLSFDFWSSLLNRATSPGFPLDLVHYGSAAAMFLILSYVVLSVFTRVNSQTAVQSGNRKALRNGCYRVLGRVILATVAILAVKFVVIGDESGFARFWNSYRLTFVFEATGLIAFGLAWMIKGRFLPVFEDAAARAQPRAA